MTADLRGVLVRRMRTPVVRLAPAPLDRGTVDRIGDQGSWTAWLIDHWRHTARSLHQLVYGSAAALATGITVPTEIADPTAARSYLARVLGRLASLHGWPAAEVSRRVALIAGERNAATVGDTIARVVSYGPPRTWPGAGAWYEVAAEMQRSAALLSAGEAALLVRREAADLSADLRAGLERLATITERGSVGVGVGVGLGVVALGVGALAWMAPEAVAALNMR